MDEPRELERRLIAENPSMVVKEDANGRTVIRGMAAVFSSRSQNLGGFVEVLEPGAFDDVMRGSPDVFAKYNHERVIGRTKSGTMRLSVNERGLMYEIDPPQSAADVVELIERGDVTGSSFAFRVNPSDESWSKDSDGTMVRTIKKVSYLGDAGPVDTPAYLATETYVSKRALEMAAAEEMPEPAEHPVLTEPEADADADGEEMRAAPDELGEGDFVTWKTSNGMSQGKIEEIVRDGSIDVPDADFTVNGTPDDPAALIMVYAEKGDGYVPVGKQVGHRFTTLTKIDDLPAYSGDDDDQDDDDMRAVDMKPTAGMAAAAKRGLKLHEEGKSGDGIKPETVARAGKLARREEMNRDWIVEMNAWFARHASDKKPGWDTPGEETPGFVAHLLWGGDPAKTFSARKAKQLENDRALKVAADMQALVTLSKLRTHLHDK